METKPEHIPQFIHDWSTLHHGNLMSLYKDFCLESGNDNKTGFIEFCFHLYFECKH